MRIVWTKEAQEDLENIYRFWASKNEPYSARLYNSLIDEAEVLLRFPEIGVLERFLTHRHTADTGAGRRWNPLGILKMIFYLCRKRMKNDYKTLTITTTIAGFQRMKLWMPS